MLDDANILKQRDPSGALEATTIQSEQVNLKVEVINGNNSDKTVANIVVAGMGGSALAASLVKAWLKSELAVPVEIVRTYDLPAYVDKDTLVIAMSYSGGTEEILSCLDQAQTKNAHIAVIAAGGKLIERAKNDSLTYTLLPNVAQPRMAVINNLCSFVALIVDFGLISSDKINEIANMAEWLKSETKKWTSDIPTAQNYAKQLAMQAVGKTAVFYGGSITSPVANKWKISWNENAKNVAFWNEIPEFSHNEFSGWSSHPVEKPFAVFDIISKFEHPQILRRFEISDRLLSGQRPKSTTINLAGESVIEQLLWGSILGDFVGVYVGILNGVDPTPVPLVDKLKQELA